MPQAPAYHVCRGRAAWSRKAPGGDESCPTRPGKAWQVPTSIRNVAVRIRLPEVAFPQVRTAGNASRSTVECSISFISPRLDKLPKCSVALVFHERTLSAKSW